MVHAHAIDPANLYVYALLVQLRHGPKSASELLADIHFLYGESLGGIYFMLVFEVNLIEWAISDKSNSRL